MKLNQEGIVFNYVTKMLGKAFALISCEECLFESGQYCYFFREHLFEQTQIKQPLRLKKCVDLFNSENMKT